MTTQSLSSRLSLNQYWQTKTSYLDRVFLLDWLSMWDFLMLSKIRTVPVLLGYSTVLPLTPLFFMV